MNNTPSAAVNDKAHNLLVFFVFSAFFLSGGCGLVYEELWMRFLSNLLGSSSLSILVVLATYMGGLSLGAALFGRLADRHPNGLFLYGLIEIGVGLFACTFIYIFNTTETIFLSLAKGLTPGSPQLLFLKVTVSTALIAAPSIAMGATLPVVTRYLTRSQSSLRKNIALLYGLNSLGGVLGILLAGFFLVHHLGLLSAMTLTGLVNIILGVTALAIAWRLGPAPKIETPSRKLRRAGERLDRNQYRPYAMRRAILAAGLSGFAAMALEMAWIRYFTITLGSTHSAFVIVVAAFICGISIGALLISTERAGRFPLPTILTWAFAFTATTIGLSLFLYERTPFEINRILSVLAHVPLAWPPYQILRFTICFALMLLPTMAAGMIFPVCARIAGHDQRMGRYIGIVYAVSTIGALLGIIITQLVLFRLTTLPTTFQIILFVYLATGLFLAFILKEKGRKTIIGLLVTVLALHMLFWQPWHPYKLFVDHYPFTADPEFSYRDFVEMTSTHEVIAELNGPDGQAVVLDVRDENITERSIFIDGKADASTSMDDMPTQLLLAHTPMLLHPNPKKVFVLGIGSGVTSGEALKYPGVVSVTSVELSREVFEASKFLAEVNSRYWENPNHRLVIDDAKSFLKLTDEKFDVMILEPTNIYQHGMAGLFSEEFFKLLKSRLAPGGIIGQWLHTYESSDLSNEVVLKTFSRVFPRTAIFDISTKLDYMLIAPAEDWQLDPRQLNHRFYLPPIRKTLSRIGYYQPLDILLQEVVSRSTFRHQVMTSPAPINSELWPILESLGEYAKFLIERSWLIERLDSRDDPDQQRPGTSGSLLLIDYLQQTGNKISQLGPAINSVILKDEERIKSSLAMMLLSDFRRNQPQSLLPQDLLRLFQDPRVRETVLDPLYHLEPENLGPEDVLRLLDAEITLWQRASSALWTPPPSRLRSLYRQTIMTSKPEEAGELAGELALSIARSLSEAKACTTALPYFQLAEETGTLSRDMTGIMWAFHCEIKRGDALKANQWWQLIEQRDYPVSDGMRRDKIMLDIKLGGKPQPPTYGHPRLY
jgi:spermidine synthase